MSSWSFPDSARASWLSASGIFPASVGASATERSRRPTEARGRGACTSGILMADLAADLTASSEQLIETHTAWVFLGPQTVWKVKKPVDYGFLDYSTLEKRRVACEA